MKIDPKYFEVFGRKVRDVVTGFEGTCTSIGFDLYGCVQAVITPSMNEKKEIPDGRWLDIARIVVLDKQPVMPLPTFAAVETVHGPAEKPRHPRW